MHAVFVFMYAVTDLARYHFRVLIYILWNLDVVFSLYSFFFLHLQPYQAVRSHHYLLLITVTLMFILDPLAESCHFGCAQ